MSLSIVTVDDLGFDVPDVAKEYLDKATGAAKKAAAPAQEALLKQYEAEIRKYDPWLERRGRLAVRMAAAKVAPLLSPAPSKQEQEEQTRPPAGPGWQERLYQPVLTPLLRGAEDEAAKLARPVITKLALALGAYTLAAVLVGRWTRRCG